jgi:DNA-binding beta-propeller fold protein YncE
MSATSRVPGRMLRIPFVRVTAALLCAAAAHAAAPQPAPIAPIVRTKAVRFLAGPEGAPFTMPSDAAVAKDGTLYVLDGVNGRVVVFDAAQRFRTSFGSAGSGDGQFAFPLGICASPDGTLYIADSGNHRVQHLAADGTYLGAIAIPAAPDGTAADPTDVAVDPTRKQLYVADNDNHRIVVCDLATNAVAAQWGQAGQGQLQFRFPFLIDVTSDGYLLVVEPVNTRVQALNSRGKFVGYLGAWGVRPGQLFRPKGVAARGERIYVTDSYLGKIQIFDLRGQFYGFLGDASGKALELTTPTGIAADLARPRLYVVELKANRVAYIELE